MSLSDQNRALIERDLGQKYWEPNDGYVWLSAATESDLNRLLDAARAEGVAALQQAGEPVAESRCMDCGGCNPVWFAPNTLWNLVIGGADANGDPGGFFCPVCFIKRAEAVGVVPTAWVVTPEEPEDAPAGWVFVPREPTEVMILAGKNGARNGAAAEAGRSYRAMISAAPLPQQTALVEQGVEKIIGPHEPAACGASAPSEPPLSAEEVELPNYWRAVVGDTYKPAVLRNVKHMHPATVKEVFDRYAGTDVADVIAGLIFKNQIANNRSEFFAEEYAKATASPPTPADEGEG